MKHADKPLAELTNSELVSVVVQYEHENESESVTDRFEHLKLYLAELGKRFDISEIAAQVFCHIIFRNFYLGVPLRSDILKIYMMSYNMGDYFRAISDLESKHYIEMFALRGNRQIAISIPNAIENSLFKDERFGNFKEFSESKSIDVKLEGLNDKDFLIYFREQLIGCAFKSIYSKGFEIVINGFYYCSVQTLEGYCEELQGMIESGELEL